MVEKLYLKNSYLINMPTKIVSVGQDSIGPWIRLSKTIFHPQGGGQKCDIGNIGNIEVINVQHAEAGEINHYVNTTLTELTNLSEQEMIMQVNPEKRALNASLHTTGHLIAAILDSSFPVKAAKGHHYPNEAKVEFIISGTAQDICKDAISIFLQQELEKYTKNSTNIATIFDEHDNRTIKIDGFAVVPCGGTHLENTNQILNVNIRGVKIKKDRLMVGYAATPDYESIRFVKIP